jgi:hypothetical protein
MSRTRLGLIAGIIAANAVLGATLIGRVGAQTTQTALACTSTTNCYCSGTRCVLGGTAHDCTTSSDC